MSAPLVSSVHQSRNRAYITLCSILKQKGSLSQFLLPQDNSFIKELCFGVCRYYEVLERVVAAYIKKKPKDTEILVCLLMGCYQLFVMKQPVYAIVKETVGLLDKTRFVFAKGFVNGVLRQMSRDKEAGTDSFRTEVMKGSTPAWLLAKLRLDWPEEWESIVQANLQHAPMTLRINQRQGSREDYLAKLQECHIEACSHPHVDTAVLLAKPCPVESLPGFYEGNVSVQDASAQLGVSLLDLKPGLSVLDACAAPGGKTCQILEAAPLLKQCVALDIDAQRLTRIHENLHRLNLTADVVLGDASRPQDWCGGQQFDRILLDAPCSAIGVIRRHPDIQLLRTQEEVNRICALQFHLLRAIWSLLKVGGRLVYATCSVLKQENDCQIEAFITERPQVKIIDFVLPWGRQTRYGWQLLPGEATGDGFYYAVLEKTE